MAEREVKSHKKRKRKEKDKDKKKEKSKKKHKSKQRKEKKYHNSSKKRKERSPSSSSSSSSDSDRPEPRTAEEILSLGRQAVHLLRVILAQYPTLRSDIRQLLRQLDAGEVVDVSGLAEPQLKKLVTMLFQALMLQCSRGSIYKLPPTSPKLLTTMAMVLAEDVDPALAGPLDKILPQFAPAGESEGAKSEEERSEEERAEPPKADEPLESDEEPAEDEIEHLRKPLPITSDYFPITSGVEVLGSRSGQGVRNNSKRRDVYENGPTTLCWVPEEKCWASTKP
eukprot:1184770-Prorocentrum_minimum.AAC.3